MLPDLEYTERIGVFWGYPESRSFVELLIDRGEDPTLRLVLVAARGRPRDGRVASELPVPRSRAPGRLSHCARPADKQ
jgi:hypothetical protein